MLLPYSVLSRWPSRLGICLLSAANARDVIPWFFEPAFEASPSDCAARSYEPHSSSSLRKQSLQPRLGEAASQSTGRFMRRSSSLQRGSA
jgi:hypothetical protein